MVSVNDSAFMNNQYSRISLLTSLNECSMDFESLVTFESRWDKTIVSYYPDHMRIGHLEEFTDRENDSDKLR